MRRGRSWRTCRANVLERIETIAALRDKLARSHDVEPHGHAKGQRGLIGLVPTMGALHAGHAALIDAARRECGVVVVSIFVNPLQFNNQEDLERYPRTLEADLALCHDHRVDVLFTPSAAEVYPQPQECTVDVGHLADHLCGKFRPGHFRGVATVVLKFFQMVRPDRAYFGEKDAQQLAIVRRMASDFDLPLDVVEVPTVREPDGLAMSSRNKHLSPDERRMAVCLYQALIDASRRISAGERSASAITEAASAVVPQSTALRLEYLEIVDAETMQPVAEIDRPVRIAGAIWVGGTRLIDNVFVAPGIRVATRHDAAELAQLINDAFIVEAFFKIGERTSAEEIAALMNEGGEFLVLDGADGPAGCVYLKCGGSRAYFGMLSIRPSRQRQGLGRKLIDAAEARARARRCDSMDIHIVNLREELPEYYSRLGYVSNGTMPFSDPSRTHASCFFIVMSKTL
jgi:pantoate--beta-alanine ligase